MDNLIWFILLALLAEVLGTLGGFGSSLFFVPLASMFFDFHTVLGITALFHVFSNISKIVLFKHGFDKRLVIRMGIPAVLFVSLGAWMSNWFDSTYLEIGLAFLLIALSVLFLLKPHLEVKANDWSLTGGGILSGFLAGLLGTGGAVRGVVLASYNLEKSVFIASSAMIDLGVDVSRSFVYFKNGYMRKEDIYLLPILLLVGWFGSYLGKRWLDRISQKHFKNIVLIFILMVGIFTLLRPLFMPDKME
jgi:uncharacterized membrane protein YfcA